MKWWDKNRVAVKTWSEGITHVDNSLLFLYETYFMNIIGQLIIFYLTNF